MNVSFGTHPNNLGHTDAPGCFRCHDDQHKSPEGRVIRQDWRPVPRDPVIRGPSRVAPARRPVWLRSSDGSSDLAKRGLASQMPESPGPTECRRADPSRSSALERIGAEVADVRGHPFEEVA